MRPLALTVAFLLGLTCAMAVTRQLAALNPTPTGGLLEHLRAHRNDYDLVVLGPSYTRVHFVPPEFEKRMKQLGHPLHAFGFGMKSMRGGEVDFYLDQILALDMPKLKWLVLDVTLEQWAPLEPANAFKRRVVYWHDPARLWFTRAFIASFTSDPVAQVKDVWQDARHVLMRWASIGEGVEALREGTWRGVRPKVRDRGAFHATEWNEKKWNVERAKQYLEKHRDAHEKSVRTLARQREQNSKTPRDNAMMRVWRDRIRARHVEPVFLISPVLKYAGIESEVPGGERLRVLDFNDPNEYPQLYGVETHYDRSHLRYAAALEFSRDMADAFVADLDAQAKELTAHEKTLGAQEHAR